MNLPLLYALAAGLLAGADEPTLQIEPSPQAGRVCLVAALTSQQQQSLPRSKEGQLQFDDLSPLLGLALVDGRAKTQPAMFGDYTLQQGSLRFAPRFRLVPGKTYIAWLKLPNQPAVHATYTAPPAKAGPPPEVSAIYPSGDKLPANVTKFYVHFSQPMREGSKIFDSLRIEDAEGKPVADPWRRVEIWSADARRFTLWVHPGRIKQGVNLREDLGPVLQPGQQYTLVVAKDVASADGQALASEFRHTFTTLDEKHDRPLPQQWRLSSPPAGSRQPLRVQFPHPLDRAQLERFLTVLAADGQQLPGKIAICNQETVWEFQPERAWQAGQYRLAVDGELEDLAGNTPLRVFDTDLDQQPGEAAQLALLFTVR